MSVPIMKQLVDKKQNFSLTILFSQKISYLAEEKISIYFMSV